MANSISKIQMRRKKSATEVDIEHPETQANQVLFTNANNESTPKTINSTSCSNVDAAIDALNSAIAGAGKVDDVQINETTVISNKVAQIAVDGTYSATDNKVASVSTVTGYHDATKADASTLTSHTSNTNNPHGVTKVHVGLDKVQNQEMDSTPTADSTNYVTSGGVKTYVDTYGGKIDIIKKNGVVQPIVEKAVDLAIPTKTSDITNDSNFAVDANYVHTDNNFTTAYKNKIDANESAISDEVTNRTNADTNLQTQINNLKNIGRFLAIWNALTGLPTSYPTPDAYPYTYTYKTGDYYRVGAADDEKDYAEYDSTQTYNVGDKCSHSALFYVCNTAGTTGAWNSAKWTAHTISNIVPSGTQITKESESASWVIPTTTITTSLSIGDVYYFDGTSWNRQASSGDGKVQDVQVDGVSVLSGGIANITNKASIDESNTFSEQQTIRTNNNNTVISGTGISVGSSGAGGEICSDSVGFTVKSHASDLMLKGNNGYNVYFYNSDTQTHFKLPTDKSAAIKANALTLATTSDLADKADKNSSNTFLGQQTINTDAGNVIIKGNEVAIDSGGPTGADLYSSSDGFHIKPHVYDLFLEGNSSHGSTVYFYNGNTKTYFTLPNDKAETAKANALTLATTSDIPTIPDITIANAAGTGNAITSLTASGHTITPNKGTTFLTAHQDISGKEDKSNKVTSLSSSSTDTQYPSAKCVYDTAKNIREVAEGKCKTYTADSGTGAYVHLEDTYLAKYKKWDGSKFASLTELSNYVNGLTSINQVDFASQTANVSMYNKYVMLHSDSSAREYVLNATDVNKLLHAGDIVLLYDLNVPDRWYYEDVFSILETSKVDLSGYQTKLAATGAANKPVYVSSAGTVSACSSTVGSATQPVYMSAGEIKACTAYSSASVNYATSSKYNQYLEGNGRISSANVTHIYDNSDVHLRLDCASSSMTTGKPANDGFINTWMWDNSGTYDTQLYIPCSSSYNGGRPQLRFLSGGSSWGSWIDLALKSDIPTTYVTSVNGSSGAVTGLATTASLASYVPTSRKINNKALTSDITLTASDVGAAPTSHTHDEYVDKKLNARFYPFVCEGHGSPYYKITFPYSTNTSISAWFMTSFNLDIGGPYNSQPVARAIVSWYPTKNNSAWTAGVFSVQTIGNNLGNFKVYRDASNYGIMYLQTSANQYNGFAITNLFAHDTAPNYDFLNTTVESISSIPSNATAITITTYLTSHQDISGKIDTAGTGLSKTGTTLNHSNSVTAQTTQAVYPIKIDAQGHISSYGSAVTIPTKYAGSSSAGGAATSANKVNTALTFKNDGSGAASGTTFDGSTARTISYNTIGAAASSHTHNYAGSSSAGGDATNADKLDGYHGSTAAEKNTYVLRDNNNYAYFNYINSGTSNNENPTISQVIVTNGSDSYYRKASLAHLKTALSVPTVTDYYWANVKVSSSSSTTTTPRFSTVNIGGGCTLQYSSVDKSLQFIFV